MKVYFRRPILCVMAAIAVLTFPNIGTADGNPHNPALECPEINIKTLTGRYDLEVNPDGIGGVKTTLRFFWNGNEQGPQLNLQSGLFDRVTSDIFTFFKIHFNDTSFPAEINIVQAHLGAGIGALYCRSYQTAPQKSVTLFMSSKTLESTNEFTRLMAHELTHHWFLREGKHAATWIEEGMAYLVEYLITGRLSGSPVIQYMNSSEASLTQTDLRGPMRQMGHAQLLFVYLFDKLGDNFLSRLLSSEMNALKAVDNAIPSNNNFGWSSFHDAFRDFQIAKFLNRQDALAATDADRDRYFIFPTTIAAKVSNAVKMTEWSGVELRSQNLPEPTSIKYTDIIVTDDPALPITVKSPSKNKSTDRRERTIRVLYQDKVN